MSEELDAVRRCRPEPVRGWAASGQGRAVLGVVLAQQRSGAGARRGWSRERLAVLAGAGAVTLGLAGAGLAGQLPFVPGPQSGRGGVCARTLSAEADLSTLPHGERFDPHDPAAACAANWYRMWGDETPKPGRFAACYHRRSDGGLRGAAVVFPAEGYADPVAACNAIGFLPIDATPR